MLLINLLLLKYPTQTTKIALESKILTNDMAGGVILGIGLAAAIVAVFQYGINVGIRTSLTILEGEYPAAFRFLQKNRTAARVLPYVVGEKGEL